MSGLPKNFIDLLENNLTTVADRIAYTFLIDGDINNTIEMTYSELDAKARTIAALIQQNAKIGDRILLVYPPGLDFVAAFFGCLYAGTIAVPTYPPQAQELATKLQLIIDNSQPALCLSTTDIIQKLKQLDHPNHLPVYSLLEKLSHALGHHPHEKLHEHSEWHFADLSWLATDHLSVALAKHWQKPLLAADQLALLQYTSGSTGNPKGVMVSHGNLLHNLATIYQQCGLNDDCQTVSWLPPYHDMGLIGSILQTVYGRFPCRMMAPMAFLKRPARWLQAITHYQANISVAPNFAYDLCVDRISAEDKAALDLSCWELALNGAEPVRASTIEKFTQAFKPYGFRRQTFYPCYGMAETTLFISGPKKLEGPQIKIVDKTALEKNKIIDPYSKISPRGGAEGRPPEIAQAISGVPQRQDPEPPNPEAMDTNQTLISSGHPAPTYQLRIVDPDSKAICTDDQIGEIWVASPSVTQGYWGQEQLTQECFQAYTMNGEGPFFRTGDLGFCQNDELFVTGRLKDLIIIRGRNYYPQDIENNIERSHPLLRTGSSVAFAIEQANTECLVIVTEVKSNLAHHDIDAIFTAIRQTIAEQHSLRVYAIVLIPLRTLKKTTSGKVRRRLIRDLYINGQLKSVHTWLDKAVLTSTIQNTANSEQDLIQWLAQWAAQKLNINVKEINPYKNLASYGFDSVLLTQLTADLEKKLGFTIDPNMMGEQISITLLVDKLMQAKQQYSTTANDITLKPEQLADYTRIDRFPGFIQIKQTKAQLQHKGAHDLFFNMNEGTSRDTTVLAGKQYINYCGYNYLGMSGDPEVNHAAIESVQQYGTSVSASRLIAGEKPIHQQLERAIANLIGTQDCVVFSAGHATSVSTITHLFGPNDLILHDILIHNSALQGAIFSGAKRLAFPHNDVAILEQLLATHRHQYERVLIITEGIFSMDGDIPAIPKFVELKKQYHAFLMIDEAHSIGTLGNTGAGVREYFNLQPTDVDIWMGTLSKSFGSCGGYIAGSADLIEYLKFGAGGFVYSAGISPANTAAALAAIAVLKREPERVSVLHKRASLLLTRLQKAKINTGPSKDTPIIPVIVGADAKAIRLSAELKARGIYTLPIFYPAVEKNGARLRFFINCTHTEEQINYTADAIIESLALINETCEV